MDTRLYRQRRLFTWYIALPTLTKEDQPLKEVGLSQEKTNSPREATRTYESILPYITSLSSTFANAPEQRYWTESLLTRHCMLSGYHISTNQPPPISAVPPSRVLAPFRAFSKYWDTKGASNTGLHNKTGEGQSTYIQIWGSYYDTLSVLLQREATAHVFDSRLQQGAELKKVEAAYEGVLLKETKFPKADQANSQVESWVDQVMANWRIMCGHTWQDEDLGAGGKAFLGRGVLDVGPHPESKTHRGHCRQRKTALTKKNPYRSSIEQLRKVFIQQEYFATLSPYMQL